MGLFHRKKEELETVRPSAERSVVTPVVEENGNPGGATFVTGPGQTSPTLNIHVTTGSEPAPEEKKPEEKKKKSLWPKALLASLVLALTVATLGLTVASFVELFSSNGSDDANRYLLLSGKNYSETKTILSGFGTENPAESNQGKLRDLAVLGDHLFASESPLSPSLLSASKASDWFGEGHSNLALYDVNEGIVLSNTRSTRLSEGVYDIDFSYVPEGSYVLYPTDAEISSSLPKAKVYPYSLAGSPSLSLSFETLPDESGKRKEVTLRNNRRSPYTLLEVSSVGSVPKPERYDVVLLSSSYALDAKGNAVRKDPEDSLSGALADLSKALSASPRGYSVKVVSSLEEARKTTASVSIALSSSVSDTSSVFLNRFGLSTSVLPSSSLLAGYDALPEIRELSGRLEKSGAGYPGVEGNRLFAPDSSLLGKESFVLKDRESLASDVLELLKKA